ncbi:hypothetical protein [Fictibacillus sp. NRS-1165]|uniref:hypothetical protein n=1 Tax=Fictibacillus sp. NRS-1165 TaxID=3144463 RepID=UPI003D1E2F5D
MNINAYQPLPIKSLALLSAITIGTATVHDLAEELRRQGLPFFYPTLRTQSPPEIVSRIVQRVPRIPFILNGTMYDPKDITRFNGQELHFVLAPSDDHMLVVDNQGLLRNWLILADIEIYRSIRFIQPQQGGIQMPGILQHLPQGTPAPPPMPHGFSVPFNAFHEHINFQGKPLFLDKNKGIPDLSEISMGPISFSNWEDEISSVQMFGTRRAELFEHTEWKGQELILFKDERDLHRLGWGDRASSIVSL